MDENISLKVRRPLFHMGGSKAMIIPAVWLEAIGFKEGDELYVYLRGQAIMIEAIKDVEKQIDKLIEEK